MEWVAFCSQTGTEIKILSDLLGYTPSLIITNNLEGLIIGEWIKEKEINLRVLPNKPDVLDYKFALRGKISSTLITLHGFTRIIPEIILKKYSNIYNGHPGLISKYPELKGFNPQKKAFDYRMTEVGSVIHKVNELVDEGEIVCQMSLNIGESEGIENY